MWVRWAGMADHSEGAGILRQAFRTRSAAGVARLIHAPAAAAELPRLGNTGQGQHIAGTVKGRLTGRRERALLPQPRRPSDLGPPRLNGLRSALGGRVVYDAGPMGPPDFPG